MATHIFQPLGSGGLRLGQTGQVHNSIFQFNQKGELEYCFGADELLQGETDGSSYMNGGLRVTHTAGGYTAIDPSSPVFIRGDTMFIPTVFVSWHGDSLDEKTPLLKSMRSVSTEGQRLMKTMGWDVKGARAPAREWLAPARGPPRPRRAHCTPSGVADRTPLPPGARLLVATSVPPSTAPLDASGSPAPVGPAHARRHPAQHRPRAGVLPHPSRGVLQAA